MTGDKDRADWLAKAREVLDIEARGLTAVRDRLDESFVRALELMASCAGNWNRVPSGSPLLITASTSKIRSCPCSWNNISKAEVPISSRVSQSGKG